MMKNYKVLLALLGSLIVFPLFTSAEGFTVAGVMAAIAGQFVLVGTWIVVIMWVVTGVLFLSAQGAPEKLSKARTALITSVVGTIVIIIANSAISIIQNSLNQGAIFR